MNKTVAKEITLILNRLMDDWDDDRLGWASRKLVFNLDKLLWNYHKDLAIEKAIDTSRSWWFMSLSKLVPLVQYTRDAVEILTDIAKIANTPTVILSESLCDLYTKAIEKFYDEVSV